MLLGVKEMQMVVNPIFPLTLEAVTGCCKAIAGHARAYRTTPFFRQVAYL